MWAPCPYIRPFSQLPHIRSGAFELYFSHRSHPWDPDSLTFTMVLSDSHFSLEPRGPLLATPGTGTHPLSTFHYHATVIYMFYFQKICFTSGIWFECAGLHPWPPSRRQSWDPLAPPGIYSKLAYHSTLCSQLHFPIIPPDNYPQVPHTRLYGTITSIAFRYHHLVALSPP
jgi:hypothetical protein